MKECTSCVTRVRKETNFQKRRRLEKLRRKNREKRMREAEAERALMMEKHRLYKEGQTEENNPSFESLCLSNLGDEAQKLIKDAQRRRQRVRERRAQQKAKEQKEKRESRKAEAVAEGKTEETNSRTILKNLRTTTLIPEDDSDLEAQEIEIAIEIAEKNFLLNLVQHLRDDIIE